MQADVDAASYM